ncbi:MAG: pitrilysin family protein, partial [Bacteroidota bacterium]|nr:pitrilysin family protein [Bacteroidota bacterium]
CYKFLGYLTKVFMINIPDFSNIKVRDYLPKKRNLSNGIPTYTFYSDDNEAVYLKFVFYNAGTLLQDKFFVASLTKTQLNKNTKDYTYKQLADEMDFYGLNFVPTTGNERTSLSFSFLSRYKENVFPLLQQMILYPRFEQDTLDIQISNAKQNYQTKLQQTNFLAHRYFMQGVFGKNNPYGKYAEVEDYDKVRKEDLQEFWQKHYTLNQCYIMLAGNVEESIFELLENYFGKIETSSPVKEWDIDFKPENSKGLIRNNLNSAMQSSIVMGRLLPKIDSEDYVALLVLNCALGGYFNSRLMSNIREDKGYTYGIDSALLPFKYGNIMLIVSDIAMDKEKESIEEIRKEMFILQNENISEKELSIVKNYMTGDMLRSNDGVVEICENYEYILRNKLREDYNSYLIERIRNISSEEIKNVAQKYLNPDDFLCSVVGK